MTAAGAALYENSFALKRRNVTVPWSQSVVFAGAAGPQCVPSRCPAGWPAAPSSPSATQQNDNKQQVSN